MKIAYWNVNCISYKEVDTRVFNTKVDIINSLDVDIIGLCETYLVHDQVLDIPGYQWFGQNRTEVNNTARRGIHYKECMVA